MSSDCFLHTVLTTESCLYLLILMLRGVGPNLLYMQFINKDRTEGLLFFFKLIFTFFQILITGK